MFDWFWEFLYRISASICKLIDTVMLCANKLCGIDTITIAGEETDFITYLFESEEIRLAFIGAALVSFFLVVFFTIYAIIRAIVSEKNDEPPAKIAMKALKSILMFMAIPAIMLIMMWCMNIIVQVMYEATLNGSSEGIGTFLIGAFARDSVVIPAGVDYTDAGRMWDYFSLKTYNYFFSWVAGIIILFELAKSLIIFVDRAISIVVLFICAPFSISTSVIDDGSHFKLWRDQVLIKFITGYGTIISLNIYALIVSLVAKPDVVFFSNAFTNFVMKVLIIIGGAFSLQKIMGLIGNLVSSGAGTQEMQQAAMANQGIGNLVKTFGRGAAKAFGLSAGADILKGAVGNMKSEASKKISDSFSLKPKEEKEKAENEGAFKQGISNSLNQITKLLGGGKDTAADAIGGGKDDKPNQNGLPTDEPAAPTENGNHNNPIANMIGGSSNDEGTSASDGALKG